MTPADPPPPSFDRNGPTPVAAVERQGVRFAQTLRASEAEFGQVGGILTATDTCKGSLLWSLKVYDNVRRPGLEGDVQDVFFTQMAFDAQNRLVIENERGQRFAVDVKDRQVSALPWSRCRARWSKTGW